MKIKFYVPGEACAQGRPRFSSFTTKTGKIITHAYDPAKSKNYKAYVKQIAAFEMEQQGWRYTEQPLSVIIKCYVDVPASKTKKFREAALKGLELPTKKPDVDNLAKGIMDSLSTLLYKDDKQIVELFVRKQYSIEPGVEVILSTEF